MGRKQRITFSVVGITIVLLTLIGLTYAYYLTRIQGNTNEKSISVTTADISVEYYEGNGLVTLDKMMPGDTFTKTFNVKNTGTREGEYAISLLNVENELEYFKDLTYVIKRNGTTIKEGIFPASDRKIVYKETISPSVNNECTKDNGCINEYELIVTYINRDYDQSIDMNKKVSALVQIENKEDVIEVNSAEQLYALSRITSSTTKKSSNYYTSELVKNDFSSLQIDYKGTNYTEFKSYLIDISKTSFVLTNDIQIDYNDSFTDDYFMGIGSYSYPFSGNFYGENHKIILGQTNDSIILTNDLGFGFINYMENGSVLDLNLSTNDNIVLTQNLDHLNLGLLNGISTNSTFENISIDIDSHNFNSTQKVDNAKSVFMSLISAQVNNVSKINNINIKLNNFEMNNISGNMENVYTYDLGLIAANIKSSDNSRIKVSNIDIDIENSNFLIKTNRLGRVGTVVGFASKTDFENIDVSLKDTTMSLIAEDGKYKDAYDNLALGGILGDASAGSDNTNNLGDYGITMNNISFISDNKEKIEVLKAVENKGGGVNVGGIVGMTYNNFELSGGAVYIHNAIISASRLQENTSIAKYGTHVGGIAGRTEHTSSVKNCVLNTNNVDFNATSTEKNIYVGGVVGSAMGPSHRDVIPLENNSIDGNNTTTLNLTLITGNNENNNIYLGGLAGETYYINKNNTVKNMMLNINGLNENSKYTYVSNFIGKWYNSTYGSSSNPLFEPRTAEIINPTIENISINTNGLDNYITINKY